MQPRNSLSAFTSTIASNVLHGTALTLGLALTLQAAAQTNTPALRVVSELKDIRMKAIANLPKAVGDASDRDSCPQLVIRPKSSAAKQVAAQGWAVMTVARNLSSGQSRRPPNRWPRKAGR